MTKPRAEQIRPCPVTARHRYTLPSSRAANRTPDEEHQWLEQYTPKPPPPALGPCNIPLSSTKNNQLMNEICNTSDKYNKKSLYVGQEDCTTLTEVVSKTSNSTDQLYKIAKIMSLTCRPIVSVT